MKRHLIALTAAIVLGSPLAALADTAQEELQPNFKRPEITSYQGAQAGAAQASKYEFLDRYNP
jgi:hypothetical protein